MPHTHISLHPNTKERERERGVLAAATIYLLDLSKYLFKLDFNGERGCRGCLTLTKIFQ